MWWWNKNSIKVEYLQIYIGHWCDSTLSVCYVSTNAHWTLHLLGNQCFFSLSVSEFSHLYFVLNRKPTKHDLSRIWLWLFFQSSPPQCKIESFRTTGTQREINCFSAGGFCTHCGLAFEAFGCFYHVCGEGQDVQPELTEKNFVEGYVKKEMDEIRR